ncbi:hypothetical protein [Amycolatopsis thermoflava]|uniref:hypothetical protein n=1 Tax=Amycolatopsis thermoflava TaxID=84480 RepID=UPI003EBA64ED
MTQRRVTRGRIVLAVVVVLVAAGVVFTIKTLSGGLPDRVYKLETACGGTTYEDAAPYTGPGPHPVAIFMPTEFGELFVVGPDRPDRSDWAAANPEDPAAVQLVACGTVESERRSADLVCGGYGAPQRTHGCPVAARAGRPGGSGGQVEDPHAVVPAQQLTTGRR